MDQSGVAAPPFYAAPSTGAGSRRNFQRRRQKHILRLRAGLVSFGGISCSGIPSGPYFVECDYDTFNFILTADDVKEATAATGVVVTGNACDLSGVADQ